MAARIADVATAVATLASCPAVAAAAARPPLPAVIVLDSVVIAELKR